MSRFVEKRASRRLWWWTPRPVGRGEHRQQGHQRPQKGLVPHDFRHGLHIPCHGQAFLPPQIAPLKVLATCVRILARPDTLQSYSPVLPPKPTRPHLRHPRNLAKKVSNHLSLFLAPKQGRLSRFVVWRSASIVRPLTSFRPWGRRWAQSVLDNDSINQSGVNATIPHTPFSFIPEGSIKRGLVSWAYVEGRVEATRGAVRLPRGKSPNKDPSRSCGQSSTWNLVFVLIMLRKSGMLVSSSSQYMTHQCLQIVKCQMLWKSVPSSKIS